jgi:hypothetical protein
VVSESPSSRKDNEVPLTPPPPAPSLTFANGSSWTATTAYPKGTVYASPDGDFRLVSATYTSGSSYANPGLDANNSVPLSPKYTTIDTRYAPLGATYKTLVAASGDAAALGLPLLSNGIPVVTTATIADLEIDMDYPPVGGSCVWRFSRYRYTDQSDSLIGYVTVADGARSATAAGAGLTNTSLVAGDRILVRNYASNGVTFPGAGITAYVSLGGTLPVMPNPGNPSALAASGTANSITLSWTGGTSATGTLLFRDNLPYALTGGTTYTDLGPTGAGLASAEAHNYKIAAIAPGGISAISGAVAGSTVASFTYWTSSADLGTTGTVDWLYNLGSDAGTAVAVASNLLTVTSGAVGSGVTTSRVFVFWNKDTSTHSAIRRSWDMGFGSTNAIVDFYFTSNFTSTSTVTSSWTTGVQIEVSPTVYRLAFKGTGAYTGFQNLTITGGGATTTTSGGTVAWPSGGLTADGAHFYGVMVELLPISGGTQVMNIYQGTTAQRAAYVASGTAMPLANSVTFSSAQRSAMVAGSHAFMLLATQGSTGSNQIYVEKNVTLTALSGAGL